MKTGVTISLIMALANFALGIGADFLIGYNISLPIEIVGAAYLVLWCWLNYKIYAGEETKYKHVLYISVPIIVLFLIYIPLVRVLMINLPLLYVAPVFVVATTIAARLTLPVTAGVLVLISILLMVAGAYLGVTLKQRQQLVNGKNKDNGEN